MPDSWGQILLLSAEQSMLVLVDYQHRLMPSIAEGEAVLANAMRLAQMARLLKVPALATEENPAGLGHNPAELSALCAKTMTKMAFSACAEGLGDTLRELSREWAQGAVREGAHPHASGRGQARDARAGRDGGRFQGGNARSLPRHLQQRRADEDARAAPEAEREQIVIAGCEAHVCLMQTALDLLEEEFEVWVVTDACSSRTLRNRDSAFDRLAGAGCELVSTEMVAFEWLRDARHPQFKAVLGIVK